MTKKDVIKEFCFLVLPTGAYFGLHVIYFNDGYDCWVNYTSAFALFSGLLFLLVVTFWLRRVLCKMFVDAITDVVGKMSTIAGIMSFVYMVQLTVTRNGKCLPKPMKFVDIGVMACLTTIFLLGIAFVCFLICLSVRIRNRIEKARQELQNIYQNVGREDYDLEGFLERYKEALEVLAFSETDLAVLRDKFGETLPPDWKPQEPESNTNECGICLSEYAGGDLRVNHPQCGHAFHFECLKEWLTRQSRLGLQNNKRACPYCKTCTRAAMLREVRKAMLNRTNLNL